MSDSRTARAFRDLVKQLRRDRKAALRECGRLGEKLHASRLEIIVLQYRVKDLVRENDKLSIERDLLSADAEAESDAS